MKIVFFGTPPFAAKVLSDIVDAGIQVVAVVSKPDRPKGRSRQPVPTAVKAYAQKNLPDVPLYQPEKVSADDFRDVLPAFDADLFVVVAYGEILRQHLLDTPKIACINLHGSLLPKYRGAAPIQRSIMNGEKETGVTIMHMVRKMDAGDIIRKKELPIGADSTFGDIEEQLCRIGSKLLIDVIRDFETGSIEEYPQNEDEVTYADKIELEECEIDWSKSAQEIHNLVRGVNPYPGAWCWVQVQGDQKRLKVWETEVAGTDEEYGATVPCNPGFLRLKKVQLEGKKAMAAEDLFRGVRDLRFKGVS